ncbi:bacillithiol biosynthesis cysteine-adding enzyme BshC [Pseudogracilibacillus sp. SE30717A]|uniref:bacillithiol biosynthesis cysteine-adding enzyme BshC n=1 Tax=Pseudogracilibacillus sp. SE30717A TaxID=3098293 RepID=UPI00300E19E7
MRIMPVQLENTNKLIQDYRNYKKEIHTYFDYHPFDSDEERLADLKERSFDREGLATILHELNTEWDAPVQTFHQIERLKDEKSVVVIGGQQAGLLTGPMYTINKIISLLLLAKEKERHLRIPVIPVFWIAGEDHDYDEINHIFLNKGNSFRKHTSPQQLYLKQSISSVPIDQEKILQWIEQAFHDLMETEHTKKLYESIVSSLQASISYVDFFARLLFQVFPEQGLVLIDSAHPSVRSFESEYFKKLIQHQPEISRAVYETVQKLHQLEYSVPLEVDKDDTHIFYHDANNERILLKRAGNRWIGKNEEIELSTEELLETTINEPERLSNNVVTRPIMQELLFPTIAFVGGDGEISYWAALKEAFRAVDPTLKVPPVIPRLSFTFVTKRVQKLLNTRVIEPEYVLNHGIEELKFNWLMSQQDPPVDVLYKEIKQKFELLHKPLRDLATSISSDLGDEAHKNIAFIQHQLEYLKHRTVLKLEEKYEQGIEQYDEIGNQLKPNQILQERIWSPLSFLNQYSNVFISEIVAGKPLSFRNHHYLIYLE